MIELPFISLTEAAKMTKAYRERLLPVLSGAPLAIKPIFGMSFKKEDLAIILAQPGCASLKVYFGLKVNLLESELHLVLVAQDSSGNDLLAANLILDHGFLCPPNCGIDNALNSLA